MDRVGAKRFGKATSTGIGKQLAIVLDGKIISAPVIRDTIASGNGQISGGFTFQTATDLALLLRSGALPAPLNIIEERTVGPDLRSRFNQCRYSCFDNWFLISHNIYFNQI